MSFIGRAPASSPPASSPPASPSTTSPPVIYDILRLFLSASERTPRGIDRMDLAYARFLFGSWPGDCAGALPTPWGLRLYDRERVLRGLDRIETLWSETTDSLHDTTFASVKRRLAGNVEPGDSARRTGGQSTAWKLKRFASLLSGTDPGLGIPLVRAVPARALYLNVGQLGWAAPWTTSWLPQRPDIRAIFMIHDVIPLERPDLIVGPGPWAHRRMIDTAARHAAGIISTTVAAGASVRRALQQRGRPDIAVATMPSAGLGNFPEPAGARSLLLGRRLFRALRRHRAAQEPPADARCLAAAGRGQTARAPRSSVIAGSPARGAQSILRAFADCAALRDQVIIASGLSSPALRDLLAHATALLMPSLAEGFGLPIIEALSLGTPVLASAIPAHLEVGGDLAIYCDPTDGAAWLRQITRLSEGGAPVAALRQRIAGYVPTTTGQYQAQIARFLGTFG